MKKENKKRNNIFSPKNLIIFFTVVILLLAAINYFYPSISINNQFLNQNNNEGELYSGVDDSSGLEEGFRGSGDNSNDMNKKRCKDRTDCKGQCKNCIDNIDGTSRCDFLVNNPCYGIGGQLQICNANGECPNCIEDCGECKTCMDKNNDGKGECVNKEYDWDDTKITCNNGKSLCYKGECLDCNPQCNGICSVCGKDFSKGGPNYCGFKKDRVCNDGKSLCSNNYECPKCAKTCNPCQICGFVAGTNNRQTACFPIEKVFPNRKIECDFKEHGQKIPGICRNSVCIEAGSITQR